MKKATRHLQPDPCPLCGTASSVTCLQYPGSKSVYNVSCGVKDDDSDSCGLVLYGGSKDRRKDVVARWNQRIE